MNAILSNVKGVGGLLSVLTGKSLEMTGKYILEKAMAPHSSTLAW